MSAKVLTAGQLLDGHAVLDIQCLDRIYLNTYVPILQTSSQVVAFLSGHLGFPFASPALFNKIGQRFRKAVVDYARTNSIPWIVFGKNDDKLAAMGEHLQRQAATGCSGVAAIGVAQEFQRVWTASEGHTSTGTPAGRSSKPTGVRNDRAAVRCVVPYVRRAEHRLTRAGNQLAGEARRQLDAIGVGRL